MRPEEELRQLYREYPGRFLTRKQAAHKLGCSVSTITRSIQARRLPALRLGQKELRIFEDDLYRLLSDASGQ